MKTDPDRNMQEEKMKVKKTDDSSRGRRNVGDKEQMKLKNGETCKRARQEYERGKSKI